METENNAFAGDGDSGENLNSGIRISASEPLSSNPFVHISALENAPRPNQGQNPPLQGRFPAQPNIKTGRDPRVSRSFGNNSQPLGQSGSVRPNAMPKSFTQTSRPQTSKVSSMPSSRFASQANSASGASAQAQGVRPQVTRGSFPSNQMAKSGEVKSNDPALKVVLENGNEPKSGKDVKLPVDPSENIKIGNDHISVSANFNEADELREMAANFPMIPKNLIFRDEDPNMLDPWRAAYRGASPMQNPANGGFNGQVPYPSSMGYDQSQMSSGRNFGYVSGNPRTSLAMPIMQFPQQAYGSGTSPSSAFTPHSPNAASSYNPNSMGSNSITSSVPGMFQSWTTDASPSRNPLSPYYPPTDSPVFGAGGANNNSGGNRLSPYGGSSAPSGDARSASIGRNIPSVSNGANPVIATNPVARVGNPVSDPRIATEPIGFADRNSINFSNGRNSSGEPRIGTGVVNIDHPPDNRNPINASSDRYRTDDRARRDSGPVITREPLIDSRNSEKSTIFDEPPVPIADGMRDADTNHARKRILIVLLVVLLVVAVLGTLGFMIWRGGFEMNFDEVFVAQNQSVSDNSSGNNAGTQNQGSVSQEQGEDAEAGDGSGSVVYQYTSATSDGTTYTVEETASFNDKGLCTVTTMKMHFPDAEKAKAFTDNLARDYGSALTIDSIEGSDVVVSIDNSALNLNREEYENLLRYSVEDLVILKK